MGGLRVTSRDGTEIAFWPGRGGRPLLLVHGAMSDHRRWGPPLPHLERHTVTRELAPEVFAAAVIPFLSGSRSD